MKMPHTFAAIGVAGALLLGASGAAFAQSHEGGYLGLNPGAGVATTRAVAPQHGSGQGGYLGRNPGANVSDAGPAVSDHGSGEGGYLGMIPGRVASTDR